MMRLFIITILFLFISCIDPHKTEYVPKNIIDEQKFIEVLKDQALVESALNINIKNLTDNTFDSVYNFNVFKENKITKDQYDSTLKYYSSKPAELKKIMETVLEKLNIEKAKR